MKVKCPYCKRPLQIPYEKIKQRVLDENPPSYGPWIAAIVAGIGIAGALGLVGGTILTRSKELKAQIQISQLKRELAKFTADRPTVAAESKAEAEKKTNDPQTIVRTRQQPEPQRITGRSTLSRPGQQDSSNIRTFRPDDPMFPTNRSSRRGFQPGTVPSSDQANRTPDKPEPSVIQNPELITFLPGETEYDISIITGTDSIGVPQYEMNQAPQGFYFHVVESRVNTLAWPKEKIEFDDKEGVNIKSTDIVLETMDGQLIHPSFASFGMPVGLGSKTKIGFQLGPLRNIALVYGQGEVSGKPTGIMQIYMGRPGSRSDLVEVAKGMSLDPDQKAYRLYFAFSVPVRSRVRTVGLSKNYGAATDGSQTISRSQTLPPYERNRSIETPLGTIDVSDVDVEYPKNGGTITVNQYKLRQNHVLVIVPVTATKKRTLTRVSDWSLISIDGRKCPLVGVKDPDGRTITGIGSMSAAGSPRSPQTTEFLFDVPIAAGTLDLYIGARNLGQVFSREISQPRSTSRPRRR